MTSHRDAQSHLKSSFVFFFKKKKGNICLIITVLIVVLNSGERSEYTTWVCHQSFNVSCDGIGTCLSPCVKRKNNYHAEDETARSYSGVVQDSLNDEA